MSRSVFDHYKYSIPAPTEAEATDMKSVDLSGNLLRVDLARGTTRIEHLPEELMRKYLGGRGLGAKILFEELKQGIDPLGPENKLIFAVGPITGAPFGGNSRYTVMASPR